MSLLSTCVEKLRLCLTQCCFSATCLFQLFFVVALFSYLLHYIMRSFFLAIILIQICFGVFINDNQLCDSNNWNAISGSWSFDPQTCAVQSLDDSNGYNFWFGSEDGLTPYPAYDFDSFTLSVYFRIDSAIGNGDGTGNAGILFRTQRTDPQDTRPGVTYYLAMVPIANKPTWWFANIPSGDQLVGQSVANTELNVTYNLTIVASGSVYYIYLDGTQIFETQHSLSTSGSFGLRTWKAQATFFEVNYDPVTVSPTSTPTKSPSSPPTSVPSSAPTIYNQFCDQDDWNSVRGPWMFDEMDCVLRTTADLDSNAVWFGSVNGLIPDERFDNLDFDLTIAFSIQSALGNGDGTGHAGVHFRSQRMSLNWNGGGKTHFIYFTPLNGRATWSSYDDVNGMQHVNQVSVPGGIQLDTIYFVNIRAQNQTFSVSVNGQQLYVLTNTYSLSGSFGIQTWKSQATFYSAWYDPEPRRTLDPTQAPSIPPSSVFFELFWKFWICCLCVFV